MSGAENHIAWWRPSDGCNGMNADNYGYNSKILPPSALLFLAADACPELVEGDADTFNKRTPKQAARSNNYWSIISGSDPDTVCLDHP